MRTAFGGIVMGAVAVVACGEFLTNPSPAPEPVDAGGSSSGSASSSGSSGTSSSGGTSSGVTLPTVDPKCQHHNGFEPFTDCSFEPGDYSPANANKACVSYWQLHRDSVDKCENANLLPCVGSAVMASKGGAPVVVWTFIGPDVGWAARDKTCPLKGAPNSVEWR